MSYRTSNELDHFQYDDASLKSIYTRFSETHLLLDNVKILSENTKNRDIRTMRTNDLDLCIRDSIILSVTEEGYSVADADGNVYKTFPDRLVPQEEYDHVFEEFAGMYIDGIEKEENKYAISLRGEDHTWKIIVKGSGDTQKWERFMSGDED